MPSKESRSTPPAPPFRWVSTNGEFAFLSFGGSAKGIIAVGGVAHGVIAIGAILSIGVISIGMNAVGSIAAFGMNAVAPIGISLINGAGFLAMAGVNSCGTWSAGGVNSTGVESDGGINSDESLWPTLILFVISLVAAVAARGQRTPRVRPALVTLADLESGRCAGGTVEGRLLARDGGRIAVAARGAPHPVDVEASPSLDADRWLGRRGRSRVLHLRFAVTEEQKRAETAPTYRSAPEVEVVRTLRCLDAVPPPLPWWVPADPAEVQWWISRTLLLSLAAVGVLLLPFWR